MRRLLLACIVALLAFPSLAQSGPQAEIEELEFQFGKLYNEARYVEAVEPAEKVLSLRQALFGPDDLETSKSHAALSKLYLALGLYSQALPHLEKSLAIREKALGPDHIVVAVSRHSLGVLVMSMGDYPRALALQQQALAATEREYGLDSRERAVVLHDLALVYQSQGRYAKAADLLSQAQTILARTLGDNDAQTLRTTTQIGITAMLDGRLEEARESLRSVIATYERQWGAEDPDLATPLLSLSQLYLRLGDAESALPLARRGLAIRTATLGSESPETAQALVQLALVLNWGESNVEAESLLRRALQVMLASWGSDNAESATAAADLATLLAYQNRFEEALPYEQQALETRQKLLAPDDPELAYSYNNLANLYSWTGRLEEALPLQEKALALSIEYHGPRNQTTIADLNNLARLKMRLGSKEEALGLARQAASERAKLAADIFAFSSERARLALVGHLDPYIVLSELGSGEDLLREALRYKAVVLDSLLEDRRLAEAANGPAASALIAEIDLLKKRLARALEQETAAPDQTLNRERLEALQEELAKVGVTSGQQRKTFSVEPSQVQEALPQGTALVEWIKYTGTTRSDQQELRYGALILGREGPPRWVPLPTGAAKIDTLIQEYQRLVRGRRLHRPGKDGKPSDQEQAGQAVLSELYQQVWAPVAAALPKDTRQAILSPDGNLNLLSFATLLAPDGRFLGEEITLGYVASGRDLLSSNGKGKGSVGHGTALLMGDPLYDSGSTSAQSQLQSSPTLLTFAPLPYTAAECLTVQKTLAGQKMKVEVLLGEQAREEALHSLEAPPEILHLATHGYFSPGQAPLSGAALQSARAQSLNLDAMDRSGLALSGAIGSVLDDTDRDGLLSAAEVATLNLRGTRLVVLSACDTGLGEVQTNNGVVGLRRGFIQAGAANLLMTLWPVADQETSAIMGDFYERASQAHPSFALAQVQSEWLRRLRQERSSVVRAVQLAGPFVLTFQGAPPGRDKVGH